MKKVFINLIEKFVIPNHPKIKSYDVYTLGADEYQMFVVRIKSYYDLNKDEKMRIRDDVFTVFSSLGLPKTSDFMVTYVKLN